MRPEFAVLLPRLEGVRGGEFRAVDPKIAAFGQPLAGHPVGGLTRDGPP